MRVDRPGEGLGQTIDRLAAVPRTGTAAAAALVPARGTAATAAKGIPIAAVAEAVRLTRCRRAWISAPVRLGKGPAKTFPAYIFESMIASRLSSKVGYSMARAP